ncbi:MAG: Wzz/FepE/Etk N-terminal domain-containing protein [Cytophagaceae bacterium]
MSSQLQDSDEIDLVKVISRVKSVYKRRKKIVLFVTILGIISGLGYYFFIPRVYKSRMILSSSTFQGPSFVLLLDNLHRYLEEDNFEELSNLLGMDIASTQKIKGLRIYSSKIYAKEEYGDKVSFKDPDKTKIEIDKDVEEEFVIEAYLSENAMFPILQTGILYYINNNEFIKGRSMAKKRDLEIMREKIHRQAVELDSLKYTIKGLYDRSSSSKEIYISEPSTLYSNLLKLYEAELIANESLYASDVNVVEGFKIFKKPYKPKLFATLLFSILLSFVISTIVIAYLEMDNQLR